MTVSSKPDLRKLYLSRRHDLTDAAKKAANAAIFDKLIKHHLVHSATTICLYLSYADEVDTHTFANWCLKQGKTLCVPRVTGDLLVLHKVNSLNDCIPAFKGILEPPETAPIVIPSKVDLFVILGVAFDSYGYRLGYGKGFTDKLLATINSYYAIGICFTDQLAYNLPHKEHDIPVNEVISDTICFIPS